MKIAWLAPALLFGASMCSAQTIPNHQGWLADEANLLSSAEEDQLRAASHFGNTQVCILTLASIQAEPKDIAVSALNQWNPGTNSVMILVSMNPRKLYLQPGTGQKTLFTETISSDICRNVMAPYLSQGQNFQGLQAGLAAIRTQILQPESNAIPATSEKFIPSWVWWVVGGIAAILVALLMVSALQSGLFPFTRGSDVPVSTRAPTYPAPRDYPTTYLPPTTPVHPPRTKKVREASPPPYRPSSYTPYESSSSSDTSSSYDPPSYDSSSSFDSSSFSCDGGGGGGSDF